MTIALAILTPPALSTACWLLWFAIESGLKGPRPRHRTDIDYETEEF